MHTKDYTNLDC